MAISSAKYKLVRPDSYDNSDYEEFEFLLGWYSNKGQYLNYLFTDWEYEQESENIIISRKSASKIQTMHNSAQRRVTLSFENISRNDLIVYSSILNAKKAIRVFKDGTFQRVGINTSKLRYTQLDGRYSFDISVELYEKYLPR